jgi:hypothetical protein
MRDIAKILIIAGAVLIAAGGILWLAARTGLPLGRLPGDLSLSGRNWSIYFPIITCIILSILITIILNIFLRR